MMSSAAKNCIFLAISLSPT